MLSWACYSNDYKEQDKLALLQAHEVIRVEKNLNLSKQHVSVVSLKKVVKNTNGDSVGLFGVAMYIEEISFAQMLEAFTYVNSSLELSTSANSLFSHLQQNQDEIQLTPREKDCAYLLCYGMTAREIANKLNLSSRTIESYIDCIKEKFQVGSKPELIMKLMENNYIAYYKSN